MTTNNENERNTSNIPVAPPPPPVPGSNIPPAPPPPPLSGSNTIPTPQPPGGQNTRRRQTNETSASNSTNSNNQPNNQNNQTSSQGEPQTEERPRLAFTANHLQAKIAEKKAQKEAALTEAITFINSYWNQKSEGDLIDGLTKEQTLPPGWEKDIRNKSMREIEQERNRLKDLIDKQIDKQVTEQSDWDEETNNSNSNNPSSNTTDASITDASINKNLSDARKGMFNELRNVSTSKSTKSEEKVKELEVSLTKKPKTTSKVDEELARKLNARRSVSYSDDEEDDETDKKDTTDPNTKRLDSQIIKTLQKENKDTVYVTGQFDTTPVSRPLREIDLKYWQRIVIKEKWGDGQKRATIYSPINTEPIREDFFSRIVKSEKLFNFSTSNKPGEYPFASPVILKTFQNIFNGEKKIKVVKSENRSGFGEKKIKDLTIDDVIKIKDVKGHEPIFSVLEKSRLLDQNSRPVSSDALKFLQEIVGEEVRVIYGPGEYDLSEFSGVKDWAEVNIQIDLSPEKEENQQEEQESKNAEENQGESSEKHTHTHTHRLIIMMEKMRTKAPQLPQLIKNTKIIITWLYKK
ncbi:MAG: hypothetical protein MRERV_4c039 [Mycoplasmataceae bacterium RV_VA103A]|nr:MAG: hypothetical protein MRERV_11c002 [Mycoplasmataceae bacterium RV_VA103A]KLL05149.1 MAG: hypothetical protein MRERV_4c039 [Mycoplasmataceae bacterium RV_VA103A]